MRQQAEKEERDRQRQLALARQAEEKRQKDLIQTWPSKALRKTETGALEWTNAYQMDLVKLRADTLVGKCEVSQAAFSRVTGENPSKPNDMRLPANYVTWNDASKFCEQLTKEEREKGWIPHNWKYRLPTETEWAGFVGDVRDEDIVCADTRPRPKMPESVDSRGSNSFGLHHVCGNVSEWCADSGTASKGKKVLRGGAWNDSGEDFAVTARVLDSPSAREKGYGFRVVLVRTGEEIPTARSVPGQPGIVFNPFGEGTIDVHESLPGAKVFDLQKRPFFVPSSGANPTDSKPKTIEESPAIPTARPVPGRPGIVFSPFKKGIMIDVRPWPPGTKLYDLNRPYYVPPDAPLSPGSKQY